MNKARKNFTLLVNNKRGVSYVGSGKIETSDMSLLTRSVWLLTVYLSPASVARIDRDRPGLVVARSLLHSNRNMVPVECHTIFDNLLISSPSYKTNSLLSFPSLFLSLSQPTICRIDLWIFHRDWLELLHVTTSSSSSSACTPISS